MVLDCLNLVCQFSIIIEPLFESYNGMVSTASAADLCRSTLSWLDQHCSLPALRPSESNTTNADPNIIWTFEMTCHLFFSPPFFSVVLSSLRLLSTTTAILTDPSLLPEQATLAVTQGEPPAALDHSLQPPTQDSMPPMWRCRAESMWSHFATLQQQDWNPGQCATHNTLEEKMRNEDNIQLQRQ